MCNALYGQSRVKTRLPCPFESRTQGHTYAKNADNHDGIPCRFPVV